MASLQFENISFDNVEKDQRNNNFRNLIFWAFILIYGVLLVYTTNRINIAEDEIYTLDTSSYGFLKIIHQSYYFEFQPPFYFLVISLWRLISSDIFFIKLFSIVCTAIASLFFYKVVVAISSKNIGKWMVVIFLLNPFTVWAALEIRLYAFLMMLSIMATYYFYRYHFQSNKKDLLLFSIICLFGIYTQYFFAFLIIAFGCIQVVSAKRKNFVQFVYFMLVVVLLSIPNLLFISVGVSSQQSKLSSINVSLIHKIFYTPRNLILWSDEVAGLWLNRIVRLLIYIPLIIAFVIHFVKPVPENKRRLKNYLLLILTILLMISLYSIGFSVTKVGYEMKYQTVAFPLFMLMFIILSIYRPLLRNLIFGYISFYFAILIALKYYHPVKTYDYKSVANYLKSNKKQDEPIFIYRAVLAIPLEYYYDAKNEIFPLPHPVDFNSNYRFSIKDTSQLRSSLSPKLSIANSFFFVSDTTRYEGFLNMNREMVSDYLDNHYKKSLDTFLMGYGKAKCLRIRHYKK